MAVEARFAPRYGSALTTAPGAGSTFSTIGLGSKTICFTNLSAVVTYVRISKGVSTASTADHVILGNAQVWISKDQDADTVSMIAPAGGGSLHIMPGEGF
jgi:hypothetical protein